MTRDRVGTERGPAVAIADLPVARGIGFRPRVSTLWVGAIIVVVVAGLCLAAPLLNLPDPLVLDYANVLSPPSLAHPFGTDEVGRDMLSRVIWGGRIDLIFTFIVTYLSVLIGGAVGSIAGYFGGRRATIIMRTVDLVIAFPFIVLVLAIVAVFGPGLAGVYVGVVIAGWAFYARLTYSEMLVLRERQFILAARTLGFTDRRVIFRHAIPNLVRSSLVFSLSDLVFNLRGLATFSFLGVGVQPPAPEWGQLIAGGRNFLMVAPWITTLPGMVLVFVSIGFSMFGEGLADRLSVGGASRA